MYKITVKLLFVLLVTALFLNVYPQVLLAQEPNLQISTLQTEVLPEYDTADILVVNTIHMRNLSNTEYSGELKWIVPSNSKTHIVIDNNNEQKYLQYSIAPKGDDAEMTWKLDTPLKPGETRSIHLEYYYNNLQGSVDKTFAFSLNQLYPISSGQLYLMQPAKATNFKITPDLGSPIQGTTGPIYQTKYANLQPGQKKDFTISYTKSDPNPSVSNQNSTDPGQGQSQGQADNSTAPKALDQKVGIYIIAGLATIVVLLVAKIIVNNQRVAEIRAEYEDDDEDADEDEDVQIDLDDRRIQLEDDLAAGFITEEEYGALLDELEEAVRNYKPSQVRKKYAENNREQDADFDDRDEADADISYDVQGDLEERKLRLEDDLATGAITEEVYTDLLEKLEEIEQKPKMHRKHPTQKQRR